MIGLGHLGTGEGAASDFSKCVTSGSPSLPPHSPLPCHLFSLPLSRSSFLLPLLFSFSPSSLSFSLPFLFFLDRLLLEAQVGLEIGILPFRPPEQRDYRCVSRPQVWLPFLKEEQWVVF